MSIGTGRTIIRAGRLIDGTGVAPQSDMAIVLNGSKIGAIEPWREALRVGATVYEFPVETVLPGLVDAHCHLSLLGAGLRYEEEVRNANEFMAVTAAYNAHVMLKSGVTTLRDNGCRDSIMFAVRDAMDRGLLIGPRMLIAGRPVTPTGGHFWWCNGVADGDEEIWQEIRKLVQEGADHIKIMASGGGTAGTNPGLPGYKMHELATAVEAAHYYGRLTTAHCRATQAVANAVEAGLDCIEHAEFNGPGDLIEHLAEGPNHQPAWDEEVAKRLANSSTYASLTLPGSGYAAFRTLKDKLQREGVSALAASEREAIARGEAAQEGRAENVSRFLKLGMLPRMVISSDAGPFDIEFGKLWQGMEVGVAGGMTTMQALQASTRTAAAACGILDKVGTLEVGKEADVLVVEANPLDDISNLRDVVAVFKGGQRLVGD
ncbi:MAG: amidohydrolase family protein [Chloroflexi bacterium]|nr:amidohydrolase family protein [Chloroflexota bacterium]